VKRSLHFVSVLLLSSMLFGLTGCWFKKKKPPLPPPNAQAPTATAPQEATAEPAPAPPEEEKPEVVVKPKPKAKPKPNAHKPAPPPKSEEKPEEVATARPPRIIIQEGGVNSSPGPVSSTVEHDEATHNRLSTAQLLDSTEANLRRLNRTLTAEEQATVTQIKDYIEQSRAATTQRDVVRAHNLALKAHLLSDVLVKQ